MINSNELPNKKDTLPQMISKEAQKKDKSIRFIPPPPPIPEPDHIFDLEEIDNLTVGEPVIEPIYVGQVDNEIETVLTFAEVMPEFPGGMENLLLYLKKNIIYPTAYKEQGFEGKVYVQFVVTADGEITNPVVLRGVPNAELFSREAIRVVRSMPNWTPGKNNGKNVSVKTTIPIKFELTE